MRYRKGLVLTVRFNKKKKLWDFPSVYNMSDEKIQQNLDSHKIFFNYNTGIIIYRDKRDLY